MVKKMIKEEGLGSFFKGVVPAVIMTVNPVIQYVIYEYLRNKFSTSGGEISTGNIIWISLLTKLITTLVTYPMLTIKTLFQANENKKTKEILKVIYDLFKNNGLNGMYKGITAKLAQTLINNTITMLTYEKLSSLIKVLLVNYLFRKDSNTN